MKHIIYIMSICLVVMPVVAADNSARGRAGLAGAARVMSVGQFQQQSMPSLKQPTDIAVPSDVASAVPISPDKTGVRIIDQNSAIPVPPEEKKDMREKERLACLNNNIGVGNTFVWASRYSNTSNYAMMVEDMEEPENNVCFVKVDMKSEDSRISTSDIASKYFPWGQNITCGSWANEETMRQRILDAKKSGRTWGTVAAAVGGAGIGVGAMELFGNKLIGGKVEGQKNNKLTDNQRYQAMLANLKDADKMGYDKLVSNIQTLQNLCNNEKHKDMSECKKDYLLLGL